MIIATKTLILVVPVLMLINSVRAEIVNYYKI